MSELRIIGTLGNQNKKNLREYFGIKNIRSSYSIFGVSTQQEAYEAMADIYNMYVEQQKEIKRQTDSDIRQLELQENKRIRKIKKNVKNTLKVFQEFTTKRNKKFFLQEIRDVTIKKNKKNVLRDVRETKVRKIMKDVLEEVNLKNKLIFTTKHYADEVTYKFENRSDVQSTVLYNEVKTSIVNVLMKNIGKKCTQYHQHQVKNFTKKCLKFQMKLELKCFVFLTIN